MLHRILIATLSALVLVGCQQSGQVKEEKPEAQEFKELGAPKEKLTNDELTLTNRVASAYIAQVELSPAEKLQFSAYLANGQREAAELSKAANGEYRGSFAPVTLAIVRLFDPQANIPQLQSRIYDPQTVAIADYVSNELRQRLEEERAQIHPYTVQLGPRKWYSREGYFGITYGSIRPWYLADCDEHRCPEPNLGNKSMEEQVRKLKGHMANLNDQQRAAIHLWAEHGSWEEIADSYMSRKNTPLDKRLQVRSVLLSGLSDSTAAAFDSKYSYWVKRPHQVDPTIHPVIAAPNHPSYPSGHSTIGKTAAVILGSYFPENRSNWEGLAKEAGHSRLWAGIHYPMDHDEGVRLGEKVGNAALKSEQRR